MDASAYPDSNPNETVTLLGVRIDGVASVIDLMPGGSGADIESYARRMLYEHASCHVIEVWRGGSLIDELGR